MWRTLARLLDPEARGQVGRRIGAVTPTGGGVRGGTAASDGRDGLATPFGRGGRAPWAGSARPGGRIWEAAPTGLVRLGGLAGLAGDPLTRGWAVLTGAGVLRLGLGLVASWVIARALGPAAYGVYAVLAASVGITGALAEGGLTEAAVLRMAAVWPHAQTRARAFFWLRLGLATLVIGLGCALAEPLAGLVLDVDPGLLRWALLGIVATALSGATSGILQAASAFGRMSWLVLANTGLTAVLAVVLALLDQLTLTSALVVLGIGTSLATFWLGRRLLPPGWSLRPPAPARLLQEARHLARTGRWLWIASLLAMLTANLDLLVLHRWSALPMVGAYALAANLASKADLVNQSLYTVLLPRAGRVAGADGAAGAAGGASASAHATVGSSVTAGTAVACAAAAPADDGSEAAADAPPADVAAGAGASTRPGPGTSANGQGLGAYARQGLLRSMPIALGLVLLMPFAEQAIVLIYGPAFVPAAGLFRLLLGIVVFDVLCTPVLLLPLAYRQPRQLAAAEALRTTTLAVAALGLVPVYGPLGAIAARFAARLAGTALVLSLVWRSVRGRARKSGPPPAVGPGRPA